MKPFQFGNFFNTELDGDVKTQSKLSLSAISELIFGIESFPRAFEIIKTSVQMVEFGGLNPAFEK